MLVCHLGDSLFGLGLEGGGQGLELGLEGLLMLLLQRSLLFLVIFHHGLLLHLEGLLLIREVGLELGLSRGEGLDLLGQAGHLGGE